MENFAPSLTYPAGPEGVRSSSKGTVRIGTRRSPLAIEQACLIARGLALRGWDAVLVPLATTGDIRATESLMEIGGKGLFTKELEEGLTQGSLDLAVHSLKDVPTLRPPHLELLCTPHRGCPADILVLPKNISLDSFIEEGRTIGTSSLRRRFQAKAKWPHLHTISVRGNIATRIGKIGTEVGGLLLAAVGLSRLRLMEDSFYQSHYIVKDLPLEDFIPCPGQGVLAVEGYKDRLSSVLLDDLNNMNCKETMRAALLERAVLSGVEGSCRVALGAYVRLPKISNPPSETRELMVFYQKDEERPPVFQMHHLSTLEEAFEIGARLRQAHFV